MRSAKGPARHRVMVAGGVTAAGLMASMLAVLAVQMVVARRSIPVPQDPPPRGRAAHGPRSRAGAFTMVVLGDSFAAGYGAGRSRETAGSLLAAGVARRLQRRVELSTLAVVGAETSGLRHQVDNAVGLRPDLAVIFIGGNDVTQLAAHNTPARELGAAVRRLRRVGCRVVVGTCPDLSVLPAFRPPLRWLAWLLSRRLAAAQTSAVTRAGGSTVSLAKLLNPWFRADPVRMFSVDLFHPSAEGYARAAAVTLPAVLAALRDHPLTSAVPRQDRRERERLPGYGDRWAAAGRAWTRLA